MDEGRRRRVVAVTEVLLGGAGAVFLWLAFRSTWDRTAALPLPPKGHVVAASALVAAGLLCAAHGWIALLGRRRSAPLAGGFYLSQLAKYVPGGLWQPVGQLTLAAGAGIPLAAASAALPVHMLVQVAAGGAVGSLLAIVAGDLPGPARVAALAGLLPLALVRRTWMERFLAVVRRHISSVPAGDIIPSQASISMCVAWSMGTFACSGTALAILASPLGAIDSPTAAIPAFALAWTVGFLALPVPAGIGVREAVLVAAVGASGRAAPLIAASVAHRLVTMGAEVLLLVANRLRRRVTKNSARHPGDTRSPPGPGGDTKTGNSRSPSRS